MKITNEEHLRSVCQRLGLIDQPTVGGSLELLEKAARWACGLPDFSFEKCSFTALRPVLETLEGRLSTDAGKSRHWFQPNELSLNPEFFPGDTKPGQDQINERVAQLKAALSKPDANLLAALQFHGSSISAVPDLPDLPLYDFVKITAAIRHCLEKDNRKLRLAGGSISGIQSYLYDIVSKRASKLLKGRSFYLQLLSDSLAERFLETFELSDAHIVYSSGGGFYVLMPDGDDVERKFKKLKEEVIEKIYKAHKINLTCEFAISAAFDENEKVPNIWDELLQKLQDAKTQRLSHNSALLKDLLSTIEQGGAAVRDEITNEEITDPNEIDYIGNGDDRITVRTSTKQQVEVLGKNLKSAKFWATAQPSEVANDKWFSDPLGYQHRLFPGDKKPVGRKFKVLNEVDASNPFAFYGGNETPRFTEENKHLADLIETEVGDPITFDALAHADEGKTLHRLGILRMDVDNLGKIFSDNIGSPASFARYAAVSRSLDWFFKGYLNTIHSELCATSGQKFSERTIIIYSGGDDLFIVGRWLETLEMACLIREKFNEWSCGNLTISGGVAILPDKFPVMQGANMAGEKEQSAKAYTLGGQKTKNAVCFFDQALNWENEMPIVADLKKQLEGLLEKKVDASILKKIDQHAQSRKEQERLGESPRWVWNMAYDFGRFASRVHDESVAKEIRELASKATFGDDDFRANPKKRAVPFLFLLQTAARWVELEQRTLKSND